MITATLLLAAAALQDPIKLGWHDELNDLKPWRMLEVENRPRMTAPVRGALRLELAKVPEGWPYSYQWSGVQREASVDIGRHPFFSAHVSQVQGAVLMPLDR